MNRIGSVSRERIIAILLRHTENVWRGGRSGKHLRQVFAEQDIADLINELQVYQHELEIQNDELKLSYVHVGAEKDKFAGLYDQAPVGYFILDEQGNIENVNQTGEDLLLLDGQRVSLISFREFISPEDLPAFDQFLQKVQESYRTQNLEIKLRLKDNKVLHTRIQGAAIQEPVKRSMHYYITVIDISESREAQELLKETKERLEMTLNASLTGIWSVELGSNRIEFDNFIYQIMEIAPSEFNGNLKEFFQLVHPDDQKEVRRDFTKGLSRGEKIGLEFRIINREGKIKDIAAKGQMIKVSEERQYFSGIIMDISDRKKLEREAENFKALQQRAVLLATLDAQEKERVKISGALHDSVCQLLYGIRINLQGLPFYKDNAEAFKNVNQLLDQAIRETRTISYELRPSVLNDFGFTAGINEMAKRLTTPQFAVKATVSAGADKLSSTIQLHAFRIIQELVNNCIKHAQATRAEIVVCTEQDSVQLSVTDNGKGFKDDLKESLVKGSGLRAIKNQLYFLKGELDFKITKRGTTVSVSFNKNIELTEN